MRRTHGRRFGDEAGYALVAAMLIMLLVTALGMVAMVTSTSETKITRNIGEDQMMFRFGEQGVDRILSHLHYLPGGLMGRFGEGANIPPNSLGSRQVLT